MHQQHTTTGYNNKADDDVQEDFATQPHPNNSEDKRTPEAELTDDKKLSNTEEEAASAMNVEPEIRNEEKEQEDLATQPPPELELIDDKYVGNTEEAASSAIDVEQEDLATQLHPDNSVREDKGTPEAELIDDTNLGNTEEAAVSAMNVESNILNEEKQELEDQDKVIVEKEKLEQEDDDSTVDSEEKKPPAMDTSTEKQHKAVVLPSSILKEPSIAANKATTSKKIEGWIKPMFKEVFNRSQLRTASPEERGTVDWGSMTNFAAASASAAVTAAATSATTAATAATAAAVSANTGPSSVIPRKPRQESATSSPPAVVAAASTSFVPSAEKPQRRYKKMVSSKSVLGGPPQAAASRKLSRQSSPATPHQAAALEKLSSQSSPATPHQALAPVAEVDPRPTTNSLTAKVQTAAAKRSAEKTKRVAETSPIPAKKQKVAPGSNSSAANKKRLAETSPISSKKQKTAPGSKSSAKSNGRATPKKRQPNETYYGPPDDPIEGGWPAGWKKSVVQRQSGATAGTQDRYWYTPNLEYKLRSMKEVKRFMAALAAAKGDEKEAWGAFKHKK
jgi:hypothetical protein